MSSDIKIRKGLNIKLKGEANKVYGTVAPAETYSIQLADFKGFVPKILVKEGEEVKAGTPLFYNKGNEKMLITSPVSGEIISIERGEKRKLLSVKILADKENSYTQFSKANPNELDRAQIKEKMLASGVWNFLRQRPFSTIANPEENPKAIFISTFDTAPLAADNDFIVHGTGEVFQTGLNAIAKLTDGKVHLNVYTDTPTSKVFTNSKNVQINRFSGVHPAGNVGVQIHHIDPINKGDVVWYLYPQDVLAIGRLFMEGKFDATRIVALTGPEVKSPKYYKAFIGSAIKNIIADNLNEGNLRFISGNVLTGTKIQRDGYLGWFDSQITVLQEGDQPEFLGWIAPGLDKFSASRTFLSWMMPKKKYSLNTNMHGEERAYVMTGQYESVLPMDIHPVHLVKAIMAEDIELMENLGIYEVAEEDFALCEFVCTSKIEVQTIIGAGLDLMKKEMS